MDIYNVPRSFLSAVRSFSYLYRFERDKKKKKEMDQYGGTGSLRSRERERSTGCRKRSLTTSRLREGPPRLAVRTSFSKKFRGKEFQITLNNSNRRRVEIQNSRLILDRFLRERSTFRRSTIAARGQGVVGRGESTSYSMTQQKPTNYSAKIIPE